MVSVFKNNKGFTLMEMVIYIAIMIIIVVMIGGFIPQLVRENLYMQSKGEVLENTKAALDIMGQEIKHASGVYTPTSVFDSSPGQLSLETTRNTIATEDNTFIDFYVDDGRLYEKKEEQDAELITSEKIKVDDLTFTYLNSDESYQAVRISMTAYFDSPSAEVQDQSTVTLTTTVSLRNY